MSATPQLIIIDVSKPSLAKEVQRLLAYYADSKYRDIELTDGNNIIAYSTIDKVKEHLELDTLQELVKSDNYTTKTDGNSELMIIRDYDRSIEERSLRLKHTGNYGKSKHRNRMTHLIPKKKKRK